MPILARNRATVGRPSASGHICRGKARVHLFRRPSNSQLLHRSSSHPIPSASHWRPSGEGRRQRPSRCMCVCVGAALHYQKEAPSENAKDETCAHYEKKLRRWEESHPGKEEGVVYLGLNKSGSTTRAATSPMQDGGGQKSGTTARISQPPGEGPSEPSPAGEGPLDGEEKGQESDAPPHLRLGSPPHGRVRCAASAGVGTGSLAHDRYGSQGMGKPPSIRFGANCRAFSLGGGAPCHV